MFTGEIVVPLWLHPRSFWLILRVTMPDGPDLRFVLDSGCFVSQVKSSLLEELVLMGRATAARGRRFVVHDVRIGGVQIPDIRVRAGGTVEGLDAEGIIGLDYLNLFDQVCVRIQPLQLLLTPAAGAAGPTP